MNFYAHKRETEDGAVAYQTLREHSEQTAQYASTCLKCCKLDKSAYFAGILHDVGKYKAEFQNYLEEGDESKRGSVNHTFAGCRYILEKFHGQRAARVEDVTAEIVAYAAGAHHGQFDCIDLDGNSGFDHRLTKDGIHYTESCRNFLSVCASAEELEAMFQAAHVEVSAVFDRLQKMTLENHDTSGDELGFYLGLLGRLILSAVVEGDRRDTAEFMEGVNYEQIDAVRSEIWKERLQHMECKLMDLPQETVIQQARMEISDQCRKMAEKSSGIFRLNVPTGGGKTLSALRFALAHADKWHKDRIIFVTPLLAILEQNAKIIRDYIGDDRIVLEHHSNVVDTAEEHSDELDPRELAVENWQKPVIITTMVQLLNTMFKGKMSNIRRFHSLTNAVIVIDEVQTVPMHMLSMFNMAVNFLSEVCNTTFLLCSATQPCFEKAQHPMLPHVVDVVPYQKTLWQAFERTQIIDAGDKRLEQLQEYLGSLIDKTRSLLVICNKKSQAAYLYDALANNADYVFHLSASMCMAHREKILRELYEALDDQTRKTICISTQVIEAGVDISFGCVVRLMAGMDHIIQSAGRCNRNGESDTCAPVYVVDCPEEKLGKLKEIERGKKACHALFQAFKDNPDEFQENLNSDESIQWYYRKLYDNMISEEGNIQDYILSDEQDSLFSLLAINRKHYAKNAGRYFMNQAYKTAGSIFEVFDESNYDAVVPYGKGAELIDELEQERFPTIAYLKDWTQRAKPYTVSLYNYQVKQLYGHIREVNGVLVLTKDAYDEHLGVAIKNELDFLEV